MIYNLFEPWKTLDPWQKKYIATTGDCFLLIGRQSGKTAAMSIKFGKRAAENPKRIIGMFAFTEKQAYNLFFKTLMYLKAVHPKMVVTRGKDKPTKHVIHLTNGSMIMCYAVGLTGEGIRTFTLTDLVIDEAAPMSREVFIALRPMLSVTQGHLDISSTPRGKHYSDGSEKYFYSCSKDPSFTKFYISAEDCPRHTKEFLAAEEERMTKLEYAQEYLANFTDQVRQFFSDELIKDSCTLSGSNNGHPVSSPLLSSRDYFLGVDIARMGKDESTFEILQKTEKFLIHTESIITTKTLTTDTTRKILELNKQYDFRKIYIDTGGLGVGVYDQLLEEDDTKRKVIDIDNATRALDYEESRRRKLRKEELYVNLKRLMERGEIKLLKDDEVMASLKCIQAEDNKDTGRLHIWGAYSHIVEGLIRAAHCIKDKSLKIWIEYR